MIKRAAQSGREEPIADSARPQRRRRPRVTVLTAVKEAGPFLPGCLESLLDQTILRETEVVVIDNRPGGGDSAILTRYRKRFGRLVYLPLPRPGLYRAWNAGIRASSGDYLTNLNADDRLRRDALEVMADELDAHPDVALVYADSYVTRRPFETFERNSSRGRTTRWPAFSRARLLVECICGPHPMWRRSLHRSLGYFDESFASAGDYDFWLRIAESYPMRRIPETLGLYYRNPRGVSIAGRDAARAEVLEIKRKFLGQGGPAPAIRRTRPTAGPRPSGRRNAS